MVGKRPRGQNTSGAKDWGSKDRGAKEQGAKDWGAKVLEPLQRHWQGEIVVGEILSTHSNPYQQYSPLVTFACNVLSEPNL